MGVPEALAYVAAGAASLSAIASAVSARSSLSAVRRANLPLVYGEATYYTAGSGYGDSTEAAVQVRLSNDGPGTAVDVRCCLRSTAGDWRWRLF